MTTTACAQSQIWNLREVARSRKGGFYFYGTYSIEMLMVGGGGGGGNWMGGAGGGAGGLIYTNDLPVVAGTCFPVIVGSGGGDSIIGSNGANTTFCYTTSAGPAICITALGGQGGWAPPFGPNPTAFQNLPHPCIVGSGGGGGKKAPIPPGCPVPAPFEPQRNCFTIDGGLGKQNTPSFWGNLPGVSGFGCPGGNAVISTPTLPSTPHCTQGGGGGAGVAGTTATASPTANVAGNGGNGLCYSISGSTVGYAGGGGAGVFSSWPWPGACGGCGALDFGGDGWNNPTRVLCGPFPPEGQGCLVYLQGAIANRGGGGGGGAGVGPRGGGGGSPGGSGVVIIRYDGLQRGIGGNTTTTCFSPSVKTIHTFTGSGCFIA
jgi:hypothetical protein